MGDPRNGKCCKRKCNKKAVVTMFNKGRGYNEFAQPVGDVVMHMPYCLQHFIEEYNCLINKPVALVEGVTDELPEHYAGKSE